MLNPTLPPHLADEEPTPMTLDIAEIEDFVKERFVQLLKAVEWLGSVTVH